MPRFKKEVLKPGKYHARTADGKDWMEVEYTRDDVQRMAANVKETLAKGLTLPISDEHHAKAKPYNRTSAGALPLEFTQLGTIHGVDVGEDHTLTMTLEADDAGFARLQSLAFVSPEIIPDYANPITGESYKGHVITHVAATYNPVAQPQRPYEAVQMGGVRLSLGEWLGYDGPPMKAKKDKGDKDVDGDGDNDETDDKTTPDTVPAPDGEGEAGTVYSADDVVKCLQGFGITLAPGTTQSNLNQHICVAVHALMNSKDGSSAKDGLGTAAGQPPAGGAAPPKPQEVNAPVMMGLRRENDALRRELFAYDKTNLAARLDSLAKNGIPAATIHKLKQEAKAVQLSRGPDGKLASSPLLAKIEAYEDLKGIVPLSGPALLSHAREIDARVNEGSQRGRPPETDAEANAVVSQIDKMFGRNGN